ncbi:MAG: hypothetical protein AB9842_03720 [Bacteroidales bacterium]
MKTAKILTVILLLSITAIGQPALVTPQFCKIACLTGEVKLGGLYKHQVISRPYLQDTAESSHFFGSLLLNANTYFWHPNFLLLDVGVEYSPERSRDNFYGIPAIPDQGETRTLKKLDLRTTLFQRKVVSLTTFYTLSQTYSNREYLTNIKTDANNWGGVFYFRNRFLPLSISYQQGKITQEEIETSRLYSYENSNLEGRINKSFGLRDKHELILSRNEFKRLERELPGINNTLDEILLSNDIFFDKKQRYRFHSIIMTGDQTGYDTLQRFQAFETVTFKLPARFELTGNYNYYNTERNVQSINQQTYRGMLRHKLFESLNSGIFYEYTKTEQTGFDQNDTRRGLDLAYEKKIPGGTFNLSYNLLLQHQEKSGEEAIIPVFRESYILKTGTLVYLKRPYVIENSVLVRDTTGAIIYQLNFDYLLIPRGNFLEIARVPGGQIPDGARVYVDYSARIPGAYQFDMQSQTFGAGVNLFRNLIGLYYRNTQQDYSSLEQTDYLTLNVINQQVYGLRMEYKSLIGGVEYNDNEKSSIIPYQLTRYYISYQTQYKQKILFALNGNYNDYYLVMDKLHQKFTDISGQLAYNVTQNSKINFDLGYRQQEGQGMDLDLLNARLEYSTLFRQISLTLGVQSFDRTYLKEKDKYNGAYFRISRRF